MSSSYDLPRVRTPALRGFTLRVVVALLERPWISALLAPLLTRGLGAQEFRNTLVQESPTFLPLHGCEIGDESRDPPRTEVRELRQRGPGFRYHRIRDFQKAYKTGVASPEEVARRALESPLGYRLKSLILGSLWQPHSSVS